MSLKAPETVIQSLIQAIRHNLEEAYSIAKEADKRARRGKARQALKLLLDFEGPALDAQDLFKAALNIPNHLLSDPIEQTLERRRPFRD